MEDELIAFEMKQVTVLELATQLNKLVQAGLGSRKIVLSDDVEGNGFHGMWFTTAVHPAEIRDILANTTGIHDSETEDINEIIILG